MFKSLENKDPLFIHDALLNNYNALVVTAEVSFVLLWFTKDKFLRLLKESNLNGLNELHKIGLAEKSYLIYNIKQLSIFIIRQYVTSSSIT